MTSTALAAASCSLRLPWPRNSLWGRQATWEGGLPRLPASSCAPHSGDSTWGFHTSLSSHSNARLPVDLPPLEPTASESGGGSGGGGGGGGGGAGWRAPQAGERPPLFLSSNAEEAAEGGEEEAACRARQGHVRFIAESIARGMAHCHRLGLLHRDLKPASERRAGSAGTSLKREGWCYCIFGRRGRR